MKKTFSILAAFCCIWMVPQLSMAQAPQLSAFASSQPKKAFLTEQSPFRTPSQTNYSGAIAKASSNTGYEAGDLLINPGISLGLIGYGYGYFGSNYSGFLPLTLNVEYSVTEQLAFGGYIGIYSRRYKYGAGESIRLSNFTVGARATFHGTALLNDAFGSDMDVERLDIYATVLLGVRTERWNYDNANNGSFVGYYDNRTRLVFGPSLGIRYWFTPQIGAFLEGGRGAFGFATLGVSFRL